MCRDDDESGSPATGIGCNRLIPCHLKNQSINESETKQNQMASKLMTFAVKKRPPNQHLAMAVLNEAKSNRLT
jgi:hypothetical protein